MKAKYITMSLLAASALLTTSCSEDFLNVENPSGEPLEEYYNSIEH